MCNTQVQHTHECPSESNQETDATQGFRAEGSLIQEIVIQMMELRSQTTMDQYRNYNSRESLLCLGKRDIQEEQGCSTSHRLRLPRDSWNHSRIVKKWSDREDADTGGDPSDSREGGRSTLLASSLLPLHLPLPVSPSG